MEMRNLSEFTVIFSGSLQYPLLKEVFDNITKSVSCSRLNVTPVSDQDSVILPPLILIIFVIFIILIIAISFFLYKKFMGKNQVTMADVPSINAQVSSQAHGDASVFNANKINNDNNNNMKRNMKKDDLKVIKNKLKTKSNNILPLSINNRIKNNNTSRNNNNINISAGKKKVSFMGLKPSKYKINNFNINENNRNNNKLNNKNNDDINSNNNNNIKDQSYSNDGLVDEVNSYLFEMPPQKAGKKND